MVAAAPVTLKPAPVHFQSGALAFEFPGLVLEPAQAYRLSGANGSGKSTLLAHFSADLGTTHRALLLDQNYETLIFPYHTIWWNIALPKIIEGDARDAAFSRANDILRSLDIELDSSRLAVGLSGGEQRLVALCRFMMAQARVVLLDEPIANLDTRRIPQAWRLIESLASQGASVILVSHESPPLESVGEELNFPGVFQRSLSIRRIGLGHDS